MDVPRWLIEKYGFTNFEDILELALPLPENIVNQLVVEGDSYICQFIAQDYGLQLTKENMMRLAKHHDDTVRQVAASFLPYDRDVFSVLAVDEMVDVRDILAFRDILPDDFICEQLLIQPDPSTKEIYRLKNMKNRT